MMFLPGRMSHTQRATLSSFLSTRGLCFFSTKTTPPPVAEYLFFDSHAASLYFSSSKCMQKLS